MYIYIYSSVSSIVVVVNSPEGLSVFTARYGTRTPARRQCRGVFCHGEPETEEQCPVVRHCLTRADPPERSRVMVDFGPVSKQEQKWVYDDHRGSSTADQRPAITGVRIPHGPALGEHVRHTVPYDTIPKIGAKLTKVVFDGKRRLDQEPELHSISSAIFMVGLKLPNRDLAHFTNTPSRMRKAGAYFVRELPGQQRCSCLNVRRSGCRGRSCSSWR